MRFLCEFPLYKNNSHTHNEQEDEHEHEVEHWDEDE
jgi:hypothetical protein